MSIKNNNILFFAQQIHEPWIEGVKNNAIKICEGLNKKSKIFIISHRSKQNTQSKNIINGVDVFYLLKLSNSKILQFFHLILGGFKSLYFVYKKRPSKIFVQYLDTSYLIGLILIKLFFPNIPIYLTLYSTDEVSIGYKRFFLKKFSFQKIIIISEYLRIFIHELGYRDEQIEYIPLSYDKQRYLEYSKFDNREKKTILFSAGPIQQAGSFFMVDLAKKMPDFKFIFTMRQFDERSEQEVAILKTYIEKNNVKNIELRRNIQKMEELLSQVGALVLPLQDINIKMLIPVALLEAMARGTHCFVSDLPNLVKLVSDKHDAIVFKKQDVGELKTKIEKHLGDEKIAKNAYEFAVQYPGFEEIIEKYYTLITE